MREINLLEDKKEGWCFRGQKNGIWLSLKKFHYFKDGVSLCGKYKNNGNTFLDGGLYREECCKICLKKLKEVGDLK